MPKWSFLSFIIGLLVSLSCYAQSITVDQVRFSGLRDPQIHVTNSTVPNIATLLAFLQNLPPASPPNWPSLGLRGYLLENNGVSVFPQEVRVFRGVVRIFSNGVFSYFQDANGLESYLNSIFGSVDPPGGQAALGYVGNDPPLPQSGSEPPYTPAPWNDHDGVQYNNNCYNYATNKMTGTFAQPGKASTGTGVMVMACKNVLAAAISDGLIPWVANVQCPADKYKVALVVDPGVDFHWYRQDNNGNWSHKPGATEATNLDNSGNAITDPRTADRDGYVNFCGFMCVRADPAVVNIASVFRIEKPKGALSCLLR
jgi:hypothetical protein